MTKMQQQMNPAKVNQTMQQFAKENAKMEMAQEMMGDTLDSALDDEETEAETGELVNQVGCRRTAIHCCRSHSHTPSCNGVVLFSRAQFVYSTRGKQQLIHKGEGTETSLTGLPGLHFFAV